MLNVSVKQQSAFCISPLPKAFLKAFSHELLLPKCLRKGKKNILNELIYEHSNWFLAHLSFFVFLSWMKDTQSTNIIGSKTLLSYFSYSHRYQRERRLIGPFNSSPYYYRTDIQNIYSTLFCPALNILVDCDFEKAQKAITVSHQSQFQQDQSRQPTWTSVVTAQMFFLCTGASDMIATTCGCFPSPSISALLRLGQLFL